MEISFPKSVSAPSTPTEQSRQLHFNHSGKKRVHFPPDEILVSCYLEPPDPWSKGHQPPVETVLSAYTLYCEKMGVETLSCVLDQLEEFQRKADQISNGQRIFDFSLVGEKLSLMQCEALEAVFRRIKFNIIDLEGCILEGESAAALFDMIEYYNTAVQLNISFIKHIDCRGWQACSRMLKKTNSLIHLNARSIGLNEQILLLLGKPLRLGSNLTTLHLENCNIFGRCLVILVVALKLNTTLRELFLAENKITASDGFQLGNLLRTNTHIELIDLSNNKLQDEGLVHLMDSLGQQSNTSGRGLSTLILWNNDLTQQGMSSIARALNSARTIKRFNLGSNEVTSEGIKELKHSFICNQTLEVLELENCNLDTEGAFELAEYIGSNSIIQKIDIRGNDVGLAGVKAVSDALEKNRTVISFQIDSTSMDLDESLNERVKELQLISDRCIRNKEEQSIKPAQDVYLSTLFNGIFSRVLPSSALIQTEKTLVNGKIQKGRFQVLPVHEDNMLKNIVLANNDPKVDDSVILDPRAKFFSDMNHPPPKSILVLPPASAVPNCNGSSDDVFDENKDSVDGEPKTSIDLAKGSEESLKKKKTKSSNMTLRLCVDHSTELPRIELKERRLSSPNVPTEPPIFRKVHSIKCCKALESLDLCSSMPLSPTKLYENFSFPQPAVEEVLQPQCSSDSPQSTFMVH